MIHSYSKFVWYKAPTSQQYVVLMIVNKQTNLSKAPASYNRVGNNSIYLEGAVSKDCVNLQ